MAAFKWLQMGVGLGLSIGWTVAGCGSDDGNKKVQPDGSNGGEGGASGNSGGEPSKPRGGSPSDGGVPGSATSPGGAAGEAPAEQGGAPDMAATGGAGATAGATDPGPRDCPTGTLDCDDNHDDCEIDSANDANNCGRCTRECGGTAACTSGLCAATPILDPSGYSNWCDAVFSPTTAYMVTCWGSFTEVRRTPLAPGATILGTELTTYTLPVVAARGIVLDGNTVLYGVEGSPSYLYGFPVDADAADDVVVAYTFENATRFDGLQLVGDSFYWNNNSHTSAGSIAPGSIRTRSKAGTTSTTLVDGLGLNYDLQVFDSKLVWLELRTTLAELNVYRAPLAGADIADVELVAAGVPGAFMIRQGDYVYWTHKAASPDGKVVRLLADSDDAEPEDVFTDLDLPEGLVADENYMYFKQLDALYRAPLAGGTPEQLSPAVPANDSQATQIYYVDAQYVYFAAGLNGGDSSVVRVAK